MNEKKAYKAFNVVMLAILILVGLGLAVSIFLTKSSLYSKKDKYGCDNSAGYAYSFARGQCVLIYKEAVGMLKSNSNTPNDVKAFLIFSKNYKTADIFLPNRTYALLTLSDNDSIWVDNSSTYSLINMSDKLILQENGTEIYFINR